MRHVVRTLPVCVFISIGCYLLLVIGTVPPSSANDQQTLTSLESEDAQAELVSASALALEHQAESIKQLIKCNNISDACSGLQTMWNNFASEEKFTENNCEIAEVMCKAYTRDIAIDTYEDIYETTEHNNEAINYAHAMTSVYFEAGEAHKALLSLAELQKKFRDHADYPKVLNELGQTCKRLGCYDESIKLHNEALSLSTSSAEEKVSAYAGLAMATINISDRNGFSDPNNVFENARIDQIVNIITAEYGDLSVSGRHLFQIGEEYCSVAEKLIRKGDRNLARQAYQKAIEMWAQKTELNASETYYCGIVNGYTGNYIAACVYFKQLSERFPEYERTWHARFLLSEYAEKLALSAVITPQEADAIRADAYQHILTEDPNCPVVEIVRLGLSN